MSDRIFGVIGILIAAIYIWQASLTEESFITDVVGPKVFPTVIGVIMGLASLWFIIRPDADPVWPPLSRLMELVMAVVVMVAYAMLLPELGFLIATALAAMYLTWRLGTPAPGSVVVGVATSGGIWLVFHLILGLSLAKGPLGF